MTIGHGITGSTLQNAAAEGILRPAGPRLLLEAIWEEQAGRVSSDLMASVKLHIADAIAFRVLSISPEVPAGKFAVGDIVLNVSISGERVNARNDESPYLIVHHEDVAAVVAADALALLRTRAAAS